MLRLDFSSTENANENMLRLLTEITGPDFQIKVKLAWKYYETISSLMINTPIARNSRSLLLDSIRSPLRDLTHSEDSRKSYLLCRRQLVFAFA